MGCSKSLAFAAPTGAHLSFYWTMDEVAALNKIDSAQSHAWTTQVGSSSPAGLFSNGIQMDCLGGGDTPHCHGLLNNDDASLAVDGATSTGLSVWFWIKEVVAGTNAPPFNVNTVRYAFEFYTADFSSDYFFGGDFSLTPGPNNAGWTLNHENFNGPESYQSTGTFTNNIGDWHFFVGTVDNVNHQLKSYLDGVLIDTQVDTLIQDSTSLAFFFLTASFGPGGIGDGFQAIVDELGLSLKGALTQTQITALYNGGAGVTWPAITGIVPFP